MDALTDYLEDRKEYAESLGWTVEVEPVKFKVMEGFPCSGYCDAEDKALWFAGLGPDFQEVAVHEYCHFDQVICGRYDEIVSHWPLDAYTTAYHYFEGLSDALPISTLNQARELELDCEKRVVDQVEMFDLPIDIGRHVQKSNAYMFTMTAMAVYQMVPKRPVLRQKALWAGMPKYFLGHEEYNNPPVEWLMRYRELCL